MIRLNKKMPRRRYKICKKKTGFILDIIDISDFINDTKINLCIKKISQEFLKLEI